VYFYDPEGNRLEIYWDTGILCHQPFKEEIDLEQDDAGVMAQVRAHVERKGRAWDPALV
jgi:catechol-2,3-dioxygenase